MSIQAYNLVAPWEDYAGDSGIVLVDTVTGRPLPISVKAFDGVHDAHRFLERHRYKHLADIRDLSANQLETEVELWRARKE